VGHWEGDTVIGAAHKQAIVTLVERKSGFALLAKVPNKSADLVGRTIEARLLPLNARVKTLTVDNGKEFADHQAIDQALGIQTTLPIRIAVDSAAATRTSMVCCGNTFPRSGAWQLSPMRS
jgi:hypothetical protein